VLTLIVYFRAVIFIDLGIIKPVPALDIAKRILVSLKIDNRTIFIIVRVAINIPAKNRVSRGFRSEFAGKIFAAFLSDNIDYG
jgi:hypothetical protein